MSNSDQWGWYCLDCNFKWKRGEEDKSNCPKCGRGGRNTYFTLNQEEKH